MENAVITDNMHSFIYLVSK